MPCLILICLGTDRNSKLICLPMRLHNLLPWGCLLAWRTASHLTLCRIFAQAKCCRLLTSRRTTGHRLRSHLRSTLQAGWSEQHRLHPFHSTKEAANFLACSRNDASLASSALTSACREALPADMTLTSLA